MKKIIITILIMFVGINMICALEIVPTLEIVSIGDTSVTLRVSSDLIDKDDVCYIYRSLDGENYENHMIVDCNEMYVDENLDSETTYYYKASIGNNDVYSEVSSVTTKVLDNSSLDNENVNKKSNFVMSFVVFVLIAVIFMVLVMSMILFKKKLNRSK